MPKPKCIGIVKSTGQPCKFNATTGEYCKHHSPILGLNGQQYDFVDEYLLNGGVASRAFKVAYKSTQTGKTLSRMAFTIVHTPIVAAEIKQRKIEMAQQIHWTQEDSLRQLQKIINRSKSTDRAKLEALKIINKMLGLDAPERQDHTSSDGTMTPAEIGRAHV